MPTAFSLLLELIGVVTQKSVGSALLGIHAAIPPTVPALHNPSLCFVQDNVQRCAVPLWNGHWCFMGRM